MNEPIHAGTHPTEGDLVRYLDHQVTADERRGMLAHLSECDACARTVATLGEQSRFVAGYLADFEAAAASSPRAASAPQRSPRW